MSRSTVTDRAGRARRLALAVICVLAAGLIVGCGSSAGSSVGPTPQLTGPFVQPVPGYTGTRVTLKTPRGLVRTYILYLPPGGAQQSPLVLVFHGAGETAEQAAKETDIVPAAAEDGYVVAFMQGYDDTWNEGAGDTPARAAGVNDVEFAAAALSQIERHYSIDRTRVAATGFSNGALLAELLGCRLAGSLTTIAPLSGPLPVSVSPTCRPAQPISVLEMHGTDDEAIPYTGGRFYGIGGGTTVLSAPASAERWASLDGCRQHGQTVQPGPPVEPGQAPQAMLITGYSACHGNVVVELRSLERGGHAWPRGIGPLLGEFLRQHPRPSSAT